jgi:ribosomal protein S18 acetylase RimI-like enzyme
VAAEFQIDAASWRDLNSLRQLERACFDHDAWPLLDLIAVLTLPGTVRLKATVGDQVVGFIAGDIRGRDGIGWITTLGVLPGHRRKGIARALLACCEEQMTMPRLRLSVRRSNDAAQELYRQAGYTQVDVWRRYYTGGEDGLVLEKRR